MPFGKLLSGILAHAEQQSVQEVEEQGGRTRGNQPGLPRHRQMLSFIQYASILLRFFVALIHPEGKSSQHEMEEAAREADAGELLGCSSMQNLLCTLV